MNWPRQVGCVLFSLVSFLHFYKTKRGRWEHVCSRASRCHTYPVVIAIYIHITSLLKPVCADRLVFYLLRFPAPAQYGSAEWADGVSGEIDDSLPEDPSTPTQEATPDKEDDNMYSESWKVFWQAFYFSVIIAAVAIYLRVTGSFRRPLNKRLP